MTHSPDTPAANDDSRAAALLRSLGADDWERTTPPDDLLRDLLGEVRRDAPASQRADTVQTAHHPVADVVPMRRRRPSRGQVAAAAAAVAVVATTVGIVATRESGPQDRVVASATLEQLEPLGDAAARAQVVESDGETHLVLNASDMAPAPNGASYELWLIDRDVTDPRSLGTVSGSTDIVVPASIDTADHPIVDISLEPHDGDTAHSGHSLMRGTLD